MRPTKRLLLFAALALIAPRLASAHAVGISRGDYRLIGASVTTELVFARPELAAAIPQLDADQDGSISVSELTTTRSALADTIVHGLAVHASSGPCVGALQGATLTEEDGLAIQAVYRCSDEPRTLAFTLEFLGSLSHGHRHLATVTVLGAVVRAVAYEGNGGFKLSVPRDAQVEQTATSAMVWSLFHLGIEHILTGYDHLVFLLGLILVGGRLRPLLAAVTAFTIAHSLTLGVTVLRIWTPSPMFVEPAIALSIVYVGVENWFVTDAGRRWLITFPFGLIHGFGFAGALQQISLPDGQLPMALVAFNAGVEAGQVAILALALPVVLWLRRQQWFCDHGVKTVSAAIAVAGVWWFVTRVA